MTDKSDQGKSELRKFLDGVQSGYEKETSKSAELSGKLLAEGAASGVTETLFHPFRWLRTVIRK